MAEAVANGARTQGADVDLKQAVEFTADQLAAYDAVAFGCPAMGDEELEDTEFEPMFSACEKALGDKPIVIFGSYSWAEGAWMLTWAERCRKAGLRLLGDGLAVYDAPDAAAVAQCEALGAELAKQ